MANAPAGHELFKSLSIAAFVTIHTFAWTCSSIIILTVVLSPNIQRLPTWINLNLSWIMACFVFAFLLTTGQLYEANPSPNICSFQAAAVNAIPSLIAGTTLALALQLWFNIHLLPAKRICVISSRNRDLIVWSFFKELNRQ
jgi:hypothetical protein